MLEWGKLVLLFLFAVFGSGLVAAGVFALIVKVGVISRMIARSETAKNLNWYEDMILLGAIAGNVYSVFDIPLPAGAWFHLPAGLFCGCFVGVLGMALAEVVSAFPVFARRVRLTRGLTLFVLAMALGKFAISWLTLVMNQ